jgi:hypothetical protein
MINLFVRHTVADYATWRKNYDAFAPVQKQMGVKAQAVYQSVDDPNDVTVTHEFATLEEARAMVNSADLRAKMQESGVTGAPTVWFANKV